MQKIIMIGNVVRDLELRYTKEGKAVTTLSIAVNNGMENDTTFIDFSVFNKNAENCHKYLKKGKKVAVTGLVKNNNYQDKDGKQVYSFQFIAENVEFLSPAEEKKEKLSNDPFEEFGKKVEVNDMTLPF